MQRFSWLYKRMIGRPRTRNASARKRIARFRPQLHILERRELLSFAAPVAYASYQSSALVTADMNDDSKPDLINLFRWRLAQFYVPFVDPIEPRRASLIDRMLCLPRLTSAGHFVSRSLAMLPGTERADHPGK
jgi:hypothetical protein